MTKILRLDFLIFKFEAEIYKFNCKFGSKAIKAKYFEMIFGVVQIKFSVG